MLQFLVSNHTRTTFAKADTTLTRHLLHRLTRAHLKVAQLPGGSR